MAIRTEQIQSLSRDKSLEAVRILLDNIRQTYDVSNKEILDLLSPAEEAIPLSAFTDSDLSPLETIVKYLKENKGKSYHEIAVLLNRDDRTIWSTYNNGLEKSAQKLICKDNTMHISLSLFSVRAFSILETIVLHLKDVRGMSFKEIAEALSKSYQTVYTCYRRGKAKNA